MTTVYPGAHTDRIEKLERTVAEQDRRIRDLEYALLTVAGSELVGASLCDATRIDLQGSTAAAPTASPCPDATRSEPPLADRGTSAHFVWCNGVPAQETPTSDWLHGATLFRPGDRCAVYTGGDPCVKPGTVEKQEHDGRWLIKIDRAGKIRASEEEMCFLPSEWV